MALLGHPLKFATSSKTKQIAFFPVGGVLLGDMVFGDKQTLLEREGMRELQVLRCVCVVDRDREVLGNLTYY